MTTSISTQARSESSDRTQVLPAAKPASVSRPKTPATRVGTARRLLNTLMRSLATPHI